MPAPLRDIRESPDEPGVLDCGTCEWAVVRNPVSGVIQVMLFSDCLAANRLAVSDQQSASWVVLDYPLSPDAAASSAAKFNSENTARQLAAAWSRTHADMRANRAVDSVMHAGSGSEIWSLVFTLPCWAGIALTGNPFAWSAAFVAYLSVLVWRLKSVQYAVYSMYFFHGMAAIAGAVAGLIAATFGAGREVVLAVLAVFQLGAAVALIRNK